MRCWVIVVMVVAAAGCSAPGPASSPSVPAVTSVAAPRPSASAPAGTKAPTPYRTVAELTAAIRNGLSRDRTSEATALTRLTSGGMDATSSSRVGVVQHDSGPASVHEVLQNQVAGRAPVVTEIVLLPDETFVRLDRQVWPAPRLPWVRLDPAAGDQLSQSFQPIVDAQRHPADGFGCFTGSGQVSITATRASAVDSVPTVRYSLRIALNPQASDPDTKGLRQHGLSSVDVAIDVDGRDRLQSCQVQVAFPDGGTLTSDQRLVSQGEPLEIAAPPADQTQRLP